MCGIAGYVGSASPDDACVERCLALMRHRGPDHAASRTWPNATGRTVTLLSTRLEIIDLDPRAHMPFTIGSKHLVYNGELYNYVEVRRELYGTVLVAREGWSRGEATVAIPREDAQLVGG